MTERAILSIGPRAIRFGKDGNWYADDEIIKNPRIARLFSQHVQADGEGGWVIDVGVDRHPVEVEDTPLVVKSVSGDIDSGFRVKANDDVESELDCSTLTVGREEVLYCEVERESRGRMRARFLRPPYYHLTAFLEKRDGELSLPCRGRLYPLVREDAAAGSEE